MWLNNLEINRKKNWWRMAELSHHPPWLSPCCLHHRHARFLLPAAHLPLLLPGIQAKRLAEGAHQVSARDQRGQLQLLALQLHLHLPLAAWEAHEPPQGLQGPGNTRAWRHRRCNGAGEIRFQTMKIESRTVGELMGLLKSPKYFLYILNNPKLHFASDLNSDYYRV